MAICRIEVLVCQENSEYLVPLQVHDGWGTPVDVDTVRIAFLAVIKWLDMHYSGQWYYHFEQPSLDVEGYQLGLFTGSGLRAPGQFQWKKTSGHKTVPAQVEVYEDTPITESKRSQLRRLILELPEDEQDEVIADLQRLVRSPQSGQKVVVTASVDLRGALLNVAKGQRGTVKHTASNACHVLWENGDLFWIENKYLRVE